MQIMTIPEGCDISYFFYGFRFNLYGALHCLLPPVIARVRLSDETVLAGKARQVQLRKRQTMEMSAWKEISTE